MADNRKDVFVINESNGKKYWNRCGQAYVNSDGSINVRLDLLPVQIQIRDPKPQE
ncbi:MAG TPA: hypothetical protein VK578_10315 [Edaphobacter sp.]|jgi:hypothetical protein|nr:hypothetical protein [Edaphobacter sp.]